MYSQIICIRLKNEGYKIIYSISMVHLQRKLGNFLKLKPSKHWLIISLIPLHGGIKPFK